MWCETHEMITIPNNKEDIESWFKNNNHDSITFDTETTSIDDSKPEWDQLNIESLCLYNGSDILFINNKSLIQYVVPYFSDIKQLIAHNIIFDLKVLYRTNLFYEWFNNKLDDIKLYDTMVAHHLLDENIQSVGLKQLAEQVLNKKNVITYEEASKFRKDSKEWVDYCTNDVMWCKELKDYQEPLLIKEGVDKLFYDIEMPFMVPLFEMEKNGFLIDTKKAKELTDKLNSELNLLIKDMLVYLKQPYQSQTSLFGTQVISSPINFNSSQQLSKILFQQLKLPILERTPNGNPSVGKNTIEKLKDKSKFVEMLFKYKKNQKLITAFLEPLPNHICKDGRVRAHFFDVGTVTGRLSSSSPNLQQLPRVLDKKETNVRDCFIADKGNKIFTCDFGGQEVRIMAELSKDPTLVDALIKGKDLHLTTANQFYNLHIPEQSLFETDIQYNTYKSKFKNERNRAKTILFGLSYGKNAWGFSKDFDTSEEEAQILVDRFFNSFPLLKRAIDNSHKKLIQQGFVTTLVGRKRRFKKEIINGFEMYSEHNKRQCFNFLVQSLAADMTRIGINNIYKLSKEHPEYDIKILASVHDEVIVEGKEEFINEIKNLLKKGFETSMKLCVPLISEVGYGNSYGEAK